MIRPAAVLALVLASPGIVRAAPPPAPAAGDLGSKRAIRIDPSLEGSLEAPKPAAGPAAPGLAFEQFRAGIEVSLSAKRREEIASLQRLVKLAPPADPEMPSYLFRLAELLWEESRYFFFEANRKDGQIIALPRGDPGLARLQAERADLDGQRRALQRQSVALYKDIVRRYPGYPRLDEVLFFLARNLIQRDRNDPEAMKAYRALIQRFPASPYLPDAWMAFGEFYFDRAEHGDRDGNLRRALEAYQKAATFQESSVYGYALYKQGWVRFNLGDFAGALDLFRSVVFFGELPTSTIPADRKLALVREARKDYVRTWTHVGEAEAAFDDFARVGGKAHAREMLRSLADLYFDEGKDRQAILVYHRLIERDPLAPDAPFDQSRIVTMAGRMGRKEIAVAQAHVFVKILRDFEASPAGRDPANARLTAEARSTAENTLRTLALRYHNEWKKTDDAAVAAYATGVYTDYLAVFGASPVAYEMRFFHAELLYALGRFAEAGAEYDRVVAQDLAGASGRGAPPAAARAGKWFQAALEGALYAHQEAARGLPPPPVEPPGARRPLPLLPERQALVDACERYVKWWPDGPLAAKAAYDAGRIEYEHYRYAEATELFTRVALDHPAAPEAEYATNLVLDAYNELGDWRNVNGWARRFHADAALVGAHPRLEADLARVIEESAFKIVSEQEKARDFEGAAASYLAFVRDWPRTRLAGQALYDASIDLAKAGRVDRAMEVREELLARYPGDRLAPRCLLENADGHAAIGDFALAADDLERYQAGWRGAGEAAGYEPTRARDAIVDAAVFRAGLRDWPRAEADGEAYLASWPEGPDAPRLALSLADLADRRGDPRREIERLEAYQRRAAVAPDDWLAAQLRIARAREKLGDEAGVRQAFDQGMAFWRRHREAVAGAGLPFVGEGLLREGEPAWLEYRRMTLDVPPREQAAQLKRMASRIEQIRQACTEVVRLGAAGPAVCALERIGLLYRHLAEALTGAPVPREIRGRPELVEAYRAQLAEQAEPVAQKAEEGMLLAATKARELGAENACAERAAAAVGARHPELGPTPEALPRLVRPDAEPPPRGYGLVTAREGSP